MFRRLLFAALLVLVCTVQPARAAYQPLCWAPITVTSTDSMFQVVSTTATKTLYTLPSVRTKLMGANMDPQVAFSQKGSLLAGATCSQAGALGATERGMAFTVDAPSTAIALGFFRYTGNVDTVVGHLWNNTTHTLLASATYAAGAGGGVGTADGWEYVSLASPVALSTGNTYITSYSITNNCAFYSNRWVAAGVDNSPLHAPISAGRLSATPGNEPTTVTPSSYYADVVVSSITSSTVSCALGSATPGNSAIYLPYLNLSQTAETTSQGGLFSGRDLATPDSSQILRLTCTDVGGNFGTGAATNLTAGKVWITICPIALPVGK